MTFHTTLKLFHRQRRTGRCTVLSWVTLYASWIEFARAWTFFTRRIIRKARRRERQEAEALTMSMQQPNGQCNDRRHHHRHRHQPKAPQNSPELNQPIRSQLGLVAMASEISRGRFCEERIIRRRYKRVLKLHHWRQARRIRQTRSSIENQSNQQKLILTMCHRKNCHRRHYGKFMEICDIVFNTNPHKYYEANRFRQ